jgi:amino acid transporter
LPISILITLVLVSIAYFGVSIVLTLIMPYYMLDIYTPLPQAFEYAGLAWAKYIITIGSILAILAWF